MLKSKKFYSPHTRKNYFHDDNWTIRDLAMFELMYSSGLHLAELASLNLQSIDIRQKQMVVIGKGNKTRYLPVGRKAIETLHK